MARHTILAGALTFVGLESGRAYALNGGTQTRWVEPWCSGLCPVTGTVSNLRFHLSAAAVSVGRLTLYVNEAATALIATVAVGETDGENMTAEISVTKGDSVVLYYSGDAAVYGYWTIEVDAGDNLNLGLLMVGGYQSQVAPTVGYLPLNGLGRYDGAQTVEANVYAVAPIACTISDLFIKQRRASFGAADTMTITLRVNGADAALTATATGVYGTGSDETHEVAIAQGDLVCWSVVVSGAVAALPEIGAVVRPAVENNQQAIWITGCRTQDMYTGVTGHTFPLLSYPGLSVGFGFNELLARGNTRLGNLYVALSGAPGLAASGKSYTFTLLVNGGASVLTCTVLEVATVAQDAVNIVDLDDGDLVSLAMVPANAPNAVSASWGFVLYGLPPTITAIAPATGMIGSQFNVTITGTNLRDTGAVDMGDGITCVVESSSDTQVVLTAYVESWAALGARDVTVQTAVAAATSAGGMTIIDNPATEVGVTTSPVTDIRGAQATLNAYLDENAGTPAQAWFEWGATAKYGESTPKQTVYYKGGSFSSTISPLTPGGYYHVRAVIQTEQGTFYGNDTGFSAQVQPHLVSLINDDALMRLMD